MQTNGFSGRPQQSAERWIPALILITIGGIFFLNNLGIAPIREVIRFWPAILIALGVVQLVESSFAGGKAAGAILFCVGAFLLARNLGWFDFTMHELWPLFLIGAGLLMLWNRLGHPFATPGTRFQSTTSNHPGLNEWTIFGGGKRKFNGREFTEGHLDIVFGGYEVDFRGATMPGDSAVLEINAVFGGAEVKVPSDWMAVVQGVGVFGAFSDNTVQPNPALTPNMKRLIVKGSAVFGGVDVKN